MTTRQLLTFVCPVCLNSIATHEGAQVSCSGSRITFEHEPTQMEVQEASD